MFCILNSKETILVTYERVAAENAADNVLI